MQNQNYSLNNWVDDFHKNFKIGLMSYRPEALLGVKNEHGVFEIYTQGRKLFVGKILIFILCEGGNIIYRDLENESVDKLDLTLCVNKRKNVADFIIEDSEANIIASSECEIELNGLISINIYDDIEKQEIIYYMVISCNSQNGNTSRAVMCYEKKQLNLLKETSFLIEKIARKENCE